MPGLSVGRGCAAAVWARSLGGSGLLTLRGVVLVLVRRLGFCVPGAERNYGVGSPWRPGSGELGCLSYEGRGTDPRCPEGLDATPPWRGVVPRRPLQKQSLFRLGWGLGGLTSGGDNRGGPQTLKSWYG